MSKVISDIRKFDGLGRVVIPKGIRQAMDIKKGDPILIQLKEGNIIINKYNPVCYCCGSESDVEVLGIKLCNKCIEEFNKYRNMINKIRG